jgi:hypothetical protein
MIKLVNLPVRCNGKHKANNILCESGMFYFDKTIVEPPVITFGGRYVPAELVPPGVACMLQYLMT